MQKDIQKILKDLYLIDPDLKKQETEIMQLLEKLLKARPDTKFDAAFARKLRKEILMKETKRKSVWQLTPVFGGIFALLLIITFATYYQKADRASIKTLQENAFGRLSSLGEDTASRLQSGGGGDANIGMGGGGDIEKSSAISAPVADYSYIVYRYNYKGDDITDLKKESDVIQRVASFDGRAVSAAVDRLAISAARINSFRDLKVRTIDLTQDTDNGYSVYLDFQNGTISMYANWEKWKVLQGDYQAPQPEEILDEQTILKIADDFIREHGIDISRYGTSEINQEYRQILEKMASSSIAPGEPYYTDTATVRYPLLIEGEKVYELYGVPYGIEVSVNFRARAVTAASNIALQDYQKSRYVLETDFARLTKLAEIQGGGYYDGGYPPEATIVDITLGTPEQVLAHYWQYTDGVNRELFVPALSFPILNWPEGEYQYQTSITIPIVKDIVDEMSGWYGDSGGGVEPKPLPEPVPLPVEEMPIIE